MKTTKTPRGLVSVIYEAVAKSGITSHRFSDDDWGKVSELRDIAEYAARIYTGVALRIVFLNVHEYADHRAYEVSIEDEHSGVVFGGGVITACCCGTCEQPWSAYDLCASWWMNDGKYNF